ncbi:hypothetical protein D3C86_1479940 [compost metagenome]
MMRRGVPGLQIAGPVADDARCGAARLQQLAVHMDQLEAEGRRRLKVRPVVQVVDVLRHQQEVAPPTRRQIGQGPVRGVGHHLGQMPPSLVVEVLHQRRISREAFGRRHVLDAVPLPQAVRGAEGRHAGFCRDAGAGQDDEVHAGLLWARRSCSQSIMARTLGGT